MKRSLLAFGVSLCLFTGACGNQDKPAQAPYSLKEIFTKAALREASEKGNWLISKIKFQGQETPIDFTLDPDSYAFYTFTNQTEGFFKLVGPAPTAKKVASEEIPGKKELMEEIIASIPEGTTQVTLAYPLQLSFSASGEVQAAMRGDVHCFDQNDQEFSCPLVFKKLENMPSIGFSAHLLMTDRGKTLTMTGTKLPQIRNDQDGAQIESIILTLME